jgi:phosphoenolpyruvate phosphomutase / 2-hydroxyethylphosphonate cytidylyltransferase
MNIKTKIVYAPMCADIIHPGHIHLIEEAQKYGSLVIGLLTDEGIEEKKGSSPVMSYAERFVVIGSIKGVDKVIKKSTLDYAPNLLEIKPDYVIHGDDWSEETKQSILDVIQSWEGKIIESDYSSSATSSSVIRQRMADSDRSFSPSI